MERPALQASRWLMYQPVEEDGARLLIFPGLSHFAMWQDPKTFNKAVLQFLAGE
jgi:pimeloyl-ACP methyl ester carboxylesterase